MKEKLRWGNDNYHEEVMNGKNKMVKRLMWRRGHERKKQFREMFDVTKRSWKEKKKQDWERIQGSNEEIKKWKKNTGEEMKRVTKRSRKENTRWGKDWIVDNEEGSKSE